MRDQEHALFKIMRCSAVYALSESLYC